MKKKLLGLIILILCIFSCPRTIYIHADSEDNTPTKINTLYPTNILDYQDIDNINKLSVNEKYIAYSLGQSSLQILNKTSREIISLDDFPNIFDIKFIDTDKLLVINYNIDDKVGNVHIVSIKDNETSIITLDSINITNLNYSDIFVSDNAILIGLIKSSRFELYSLSGDMESTENIHSFSHDYFSSAYHLTITENNYYVFFLDNSTKKVVTLPYNSSSNNISPTNVNYNIQVLDYYNFNNKEYLITFTVENSCLISLDNLSFAQSSVFNDIKLVITDIDIFDGKIYISDTENNTISSYTIITEESEDKLKEDSVLISSAHSSVGRFDNISNIFIQNNSLFISDTNNNRIQIINQDLECKTLNSEQSIPTPQSIVVDNNRNLYIAKTISSKTSAIAKYKIDNTNNYTEETSYISYDTTTLGLVSDMTVSNDNNIYLIDYINKNLVQLNNTTGLQSKLRLNFNTSKDTKIEYLKGLNKIVILNENRLFLIDPINLDNNLEPIVNTISIDSCVDITCDTEAIYTLHDSKIGLITISNNSMVISENPLNDPIFSNFSTISFDIANRQMFAFNKNKQCIEYFNVNLLDSSFNFEEIKNNILVNKNQSPFAINVINNGIIYDLPYNLGNQYIGIHNCIGIESFEDYYRVLFEHDNILKIGFIDKTYTQIVPHDTTRTIKVITTNLQVPVYKYPTILRLDNQAIITSHIPINTHITISYNPFPISIDSKQFYTYEIDGQVGYIFNADVVLSNATNITPLQHNNASIIAIAEEEIYIYNDDKSKVIGTLYNDDQIYVESYDKNSEYTKIVYKDANLNTITGFVKTEYIEMNELDSNKIMLICIIIISIVILIIIITSYIIIKKRK